MLDIEGAGPSLGQHVVIGCCDVDCAGARALLSTQMTPPAAGSWKKVVQTVTCRDLGDAVCTSTEQKAAPLSIVHFTAPGARQANVSFVSPGRPQLVAHCYLHTGVTYYHQHGIYQSDCEDPCPSSVSATRVSGLCVIKNLADSLRCSTKRTSRAWRFSVL